MSITMLSGHAAQDVITQRNRCCSPLLRLPAELRNDIYTHAYGPRDILVDKLSTNDEESVTFFENPQPFTPRQSLNLTQVCRQIHSETRLLYWATRMLRFGPPSEDDSAMRNLLKGLSVDKCAAIREIAVHKEEVVLQALWEQLPRLSGLRTVVLWGTYWTWGTEEGLARELRWIREDVRALVGHEVGVDIEKELCGQEASEEVLSPAEAL